MRKKSINTRDSESSGRKVVYQRGNQKDGSPHYIFLYPEDDQSEEEEQFSLKPRNAALPRKIEVINVHVQSEDTLQALALRYQCTISELKRINNIHKDNEIHAHCLIKVPVQPYSLLTETIHQKDLTSTNCDKLIDEHTEEAFPENNVNYVNFPNSKTSSSIEINNIILNSTIEPLLQFNSETSEILEETETDQLIYSVENSGKNSDNYVVSTFKCSGADWGLSWFQIICLFLLLGFAGPIIYILYIAESSNKHHDSSHVTDKITNRSEKF